jgi:K+-sensing histidine kinase KdpD
VVVLSFPLLLALCFVAVGCLDYLSTFPLFSFRINHPEDISGIAAFLAASLIVIGIVRRLQCEGVSAPRVRNNGRRYPTIYFTLDAAGIALSVNQFGAEQLLRFPPADL